jgi:CcmD family protein
MRRRRQPKLSALLTLIAAMLTPLLALAQYEPVDETTRKVTDPNPYILAAYGFMWVAVLVYVVLLARGLTRARGEIESLRRRLDSGGG